MFKRMKMIKINKFYQLLIPIVLVINTPLLAQEQEFTFGIQTNPTDSDYWWLEKNNFGIKPDNFHFQSTWTLKTLKTTYVINILGQDDKEKIYFNESFIKHNFSDKTFLRLGRYYKDFSSYMNDELSSGHMLISHNAEPMPKVGLVTSQKINKFDRFTFDFGIAHGVFDKNDFYTKAPLLHEKFLYMNFKKNNYQIGFGLVHEVMWAGSTAKLGDQPNTFKDFIKVFFSEDGEKMSGDAHANALGNHLGIWDLFFQKKNNNQTLKLYYQHIFEDTSGLRLRNEIDGLWGAELKNYIPNTTILFEYLDTTHCCIDPPYVDDQYYDNYQYDLGWSYKNYTLGNSFISRLPFTTTKVLHMGASGQISSYYYQIKVSRKIDISDTMKYKINIVKEINNQNKINIFIVNDSNQSNGIGIGISRLL